MNSYRIDWIHGSVKGLSYINARSMFHALAMFTVQFREYTVIGVKFSEYQTN